ncbi:MAG TPA: hypothetical protein VL357_03840 [Rariglobus sp.]|nr:hypothetical protein [Rariglobus sp.]
MTDSSTQHITDDNRCTKKGWSMNCWIAAALAFAAVILFSLFARQAWEDYYITFRSSQNLVEGHGLVYQTGEHVHTFTSPLGVLVPALGYWLTGDAGGALWVLRIMGAAGLAGAMLLMGKYAQDYAMSGTAIWVILILGVLDVKTIGFSSNGMETGLLVFFTAFVWREFNRPSDARWMPLALGYAGLMWTRPDTCVLIIAMMSGVWLFSDGTNKRPWRTSLLKAAMVGGLLYAPWFFGAWHYYGSPVPQTILAKAGLTPEGFSFARIALAPLRCLVEPTALDGLSAPAYFYASAWPRDLLDLCRFLARGAAFLWLIPVLPRPARAASFAVLIGGVYLHQIMPYPWYFAPWTLLAACAWAGVIETTSRHALTWVRSTGRIGLTVAAILSLSLLAMGAYTARQQQTIVEDQGRLRIGQWLKTNAGPADTVFLESLGYMGYFSGLKMLDFPGLCAPSVSSLVHSGQRSYAEIIAALKPNWVVIRPNEYYDQHLNENNGLKNYKLVWTSDVRAQIKAVSFLPGRGALEADAVYFVFHRNE